MRVTITIRVNNCELDTVRCFQHLGQPKTQDLSYNTCVNCNLKKARARWAHFSKVLQQEGATASIIGMFYKAAVKSVLLYGCETWALTERILQHNTTQHNTAATQKHQSHYKPRHPQSLRGFPRVPSVQTMSHQQAAHGDQTKDCHTSQKQLCTGTSTPYSHIMNTYFRTS